MERWCVEGGKICWGDCEKGIEWGSAVWEICGLRVEPSIRVTGESPVHGAHLGCGSGR